MDEFIYCVLDLKVLLKQCEKNNIGHILLLRKKFDDRFNNLNIPVTRIVNCIEGIDTQKWAPKCFIKNINFDAEADHSWTVHYLPVKNCIRCVGNFDIIRFNHYNVNEAQLSWMRNFYKTEEDFHLNAICLSIKNTFEYKKE